MMRGTSPIYLATKKVAKTCLDNKIIFFYKKFKRNQEEEESEEDMQGKRNVEK